MKLKPEIFGTPNQTLKINRVPHDIKVIVSAADRINKNKKLFLNWRHKDQCFFFLTIYECERFNIHEWANTNYIIEPEIQLKWLRHGYFKVKTSFNFIKLTQTMFLCIQLNFLWVLKIAKQKKLKKKTRKSNGSSIKRTYIS